MEETIKQWINEKDLPELLRTIQKLCYQKYERDSRVVYEKYCVSDRDFYVEAPPEERKAADLASAFLSISLDYLAKGFERAVSLAGMTHAERDAIHRREKIAELEKSLEQAKRLAAPSP